MDNSLTCPKCFRTIPRDVDPGKNDDTYSVPDDRALSTERYNKIIIGILAFIPSLFGIMGMAQMYERKYVLGAKFLIGGLVLFLLLFGAGVMFSKGGVLMFLSIGMFVIFGFMFVALYVIQALDAFARAIFKL